LTDTAVFFSDVQKPNFIYQHSAVYFIPFGPVINLLAKYFKTL